MAVSQKTTLNFQISYNEDGITISVKVDSSPNQDSLQRMHTLEAILKRQAITYDNQNEFVRVYLSSERDVEKVLETFRVFEKQDKVKETKIYAHKNIASTLEEKLKSIFPPPEAAISVSEAHP